MTGHDVIEMRRELAHVAAAIAIVEGLQRDAADRTARVESRVVEIELWRARLQGAAAASRIVWLLAGGALTGLLIELSRSM